MTSAEDLLADKKWRWRHSAWMLWHLAPFGVLSFVAFGYIGIRARNKTWLSLSVAMLGLLVWGFIDTSLGFVLFLAWVAAIVSSFFINRRWLTWLAHEGPMVPWYASATRTTGSAPETEILGALPRSQQPLAVHSPPPEGRLPAAVAPMKLDLNKASVEQLALLPGLTREDAQRIVETRHKTGGYTDVAGLVTHAGVKPHIYAILRERLEVGAAPVQPRRDPAKIDRQEATGRRIEF